jgi:hypothetical protein
VLPSRTAPILEDEADAARIEAERVDADALLQSYAKVDKLAKNVRFKDPSQSPQFQQEAMEVEEISDDEPRIQEEKSAGADTENIAKAFSRNKNKGKERMPVEAAQKLKSKPKSDTAPEKPKKSSKSNSRSVESGDEVSGDADSTSEKRMTRKLYRRGRSHDVDSEDDGEDGEQPPFEVTDDVGDVQEVSSRKKRKEPEPVVPKKKKDPFAFDVDDDAPEGPWTISEPPKKKKKTTEVTPSSPKKPKVAKKEKTKVTKVKSTPKPKPIPKPKQTNAKKRKRDDSDDGENDGEELGSDDMGETQQELPKMRKALYEETNDTYDVQETPYSIPDMPDVVSDEEGDNGEASDEDEEDEFDAMEVEEPKKPAKPRPKKVLRSLIFKNTFFIVTGVKSDPNCSAEALKEIIISHGGVIVNDILNRPPLKVSRSKLPRAVLVSDEPQRTYKYIVALATRVPCVHYKWVLECDEQNEVVDLGPHLLPAGYLRNGEPVKMCAVTSQFLL